MMGLRVLKKYDKDCDKEYYIRVMENLDDFTKDILIDQNDHYTHPWTKPTWVKAYFDEKEDLPPVYERCAGHIFVGRPKMMSEEW